MSNLIKSNYIYINNSKEIIDSNLSFHALTETKGKEWVKNLHVVEREELSANDLNVASMQQLIDEEQALIVQSAEQMINDARKKAMDIINQAKAEAENIKALAVEEGKKLGYVKGFEAGSQEIKRLEEELKNQLEKQEEEYQKLLQEVEPHFVDIMAGLIEKLTNIVVEEQRGVILYLIDRAITNQEKNDDFTVWVSKEDFEFVKMNSNRISASINEDIQLQILEDASLSKNQCLIETNGHYIDCSLDIQLSNLITDLKMLLVE